MPDERRLTNGPTRNLATLTVEVFADTHIAPDDEKPYFVKVQHWAAPGEPRQQNVFEFGDDPVGQAAEAVDTMMRQIGVAPARERPPVTHDFVVRYDEDEEDMAYSICSCGWKSKLADTSEASAMGRTHLADSG